MITMAFSFTPEQLKIIEHNRRFYNDRPETHVLIHAYELTAQVNYLYHLRSEGRSCADDVLAMEHVKIMHEQASDDHLRLAMANWLRETREREAG